MRPRFDRLMAHAVPASIVFVGIAAWSYILTGDWPPEYILVGASVGGMLSPHLWGLIHRLRGNAEDSSEPE